MKFVATGWRRTAGGRWRVAPRPPPRSAGLADLHASTTAARAARCRCTWHDGRAYVVGKPGNEYQLSVRSRQRRGGAGGAVGGLAST